MGGDLLERSFSRQCAIFHPGKASKCRHKLNTLPPWKSAELQERVEAILANDEGLINRETKGIVVSDNIFQYQKIHIKALKDSIPIHFKNDPIVLHTGIDPSGGGASSDWACVTIANEDGKFPVSFMHFSYTNHELI
jgi:hypothetical protein